MAAWIGVWAMQCDHPGVGPPGRFSILPYDVVRKDPVLLQPRNLLRTTRGVERTAAILL